MSSVLVVVIVVGVIVVAIMAMTLSDGPKPPTPAEPPRRDPAPPAPRGWEPPLHEDAPAPVPQGVPDVRSFLHRVRSAVLLVVTVAVLGAATAGALGGIVFLGARFLNRALG